MGKELPVCAHQEGVYQSQWCPAMALAPSQLGALDGKESQQPALPNALIVCCVLSGLPWETWGTAECLSHLLLPNLQSGLAYLLAANRTQQPGRKL